VRCPVFAGSGKLLGQEKIGPNHNTLELGSIHPCREASALTTDLPVPAVGARVRFPGLFGSLRRIAGQGVVAVLGSARPLGRESVTSLGGGWMLDWKLESVCLFFSSWVSLLENDGVRAEKCSDNIKIYK
jgi:hypothetical protein